MQKWEYLHCSVHTDSDGVWLVNKVNGSPTLKTEEGFLRTKIVADQPFLSDFLERVGEEGWELVTSLHFTFVFKLPKTQSGEYVKIDLE